MKKLLTAIAASVLMVTGAQAADLGGYGEDLAQAKRDLWTGFYVEGGLGATSSNVEIENMVTLGDISYAAHIGIGYDMLIAKHIVVGAFGRLALEDISHDVGGFNVADTQYSYMVGARAGFTPRNDWMLYALVGYKWSELDFNNQITNSDADRGGFVLGGGIEAFLTDSLFVGFEVTTTMYDDETLQGVKIDSDEYTGMMRFGFKM